MMKESKDKKDILLGRGPLCYRNPGNVVFRHMIQFHVENYALNAPRSVKRDIVQSLIQEAHRQGRRFLARISTSSPAFTRKNTTMDNLCEERNIDNEQKDEEEDDDDSWYEASPALIRSKVSHALRDARNSILQHQQRKLQVQTNHKHQQQPAQIMMNHTRSFNPHNLGMQARKSYFPVSSASIMTTNNIPAAPVSYNPACAWTQRTLSSSPNERYVNSYRSKLFLIHYLISPSFPPLSKSYVRFEYDDISPIHRVKRASIESRKLVTVNHTENWHETPNSFPVSSNSKGGEQPSTAESQDIVVYAIALLELWTSQQHNQHHQHPPPAPKSRNSLEAQISAFPTKSSNHLLDETIVTNGA
jgi:hypothetical protein